MVWKKIRNVREKISEKCMEKNPGGQKFLATRGKGDFVKFYLAPPQNACCPSNDPPQMPRPGAATVAGRHYIIAPSCSKDKLWNALAYALNDVCRYHREIHKFS